MQARQQGFTLVEVMFVAAIIAVLVAIAVPQFRAYSIKAEDKAAASDARNFLTYAVAASK